MSNKKYKVKKIKQSDNKAIEVKAKEEDLFFKQFNHQYWNEMADLAVRSGYISEDNILTNLLGA
jgi:hypothetical protein